MAQVINTNVAALFAGAALNKSALALQTAQQRLSSGVRINSAKDDASGLATATGYDTQIRTANVNIRNYNDVISTAQTKDGMMGQITENLQRISEILSGAGNSAGTAETAALLAENGVINTAGNLGLSLTTTGSVGAVTTDLATVGTARAAQGATMAAYASKVAVEQITSVNLSAAYSRIMDTDYAAESTNMTRANILQQAGTAALAQANQTPNTVLTLLR
ncbi:MAG: flagellin [Sulfurimicrobium sp.]|jgi:flagellin|nr:flagellin [Sulfurimicrobium sp.]MDO9188823.1 flagellin [Sulfurimicrobium sp.]MDP1705787.1 flagellin [Sulfurimicrobium sp.]MDP2196969.1 flagellin [Sulfurimicrobium sp.]MDP2963029.1 flagellin [Sulfurimicrobium sp.]